MEGLFAEANRATERVLLRNGVELLEVNRQVCCGALHAHAGEIQTARELARKNIDAFESSGCERVVVNSAGCGAAMKEYKNLLESDLAYSQKATEFSSKVRDLSEFLVECGIEPPPDRLPLRVGYDAPCHLIHAQRIVRAPTEMLGTIPGVDVFPLGGFEECCGGAGIYNILHPDLADRILSEKVDNIRRSGADIITTPNPGCIMQIGMGLLKAGICIDVVHPIELLDQAYGDR
jgi:glycolate oxidase iron-sulfur subunit